MRMGGPRRHHQNRGKRCDSERSEGSVSTIGVCRDEAHVQGARAALNPQHGVASETDSPWRARLRWELLWFLAAKLAALTLIWALFFRK